MSETSQASSDNEKGKRPHGSRKRAVHNEVERRRKDKINGWITKIGELLPSKDLNKQSKISILEQTVDYIKLLASEREKLLSENRSEVQAEEVKQLQKDLKLVQEQNAVYEKLLHQANISLNTLPKKALKYSDRFERRNGVLTVKNSDLNINSRVDSAIQVSTDLAHIYDANTVSSITTVPTNNPPKKTNVIKKRKAIAKKPIKAKIIGPTPLSISSTPAVQASTCTIDSSSTIHAVPLGVNVSQGNAVLNVACSNSASIHAGGVTTALSQFPLMSTTHGSSLVDMCNKNMSAIIIPSGGGILQHFPTVEKPSNTISIICPNTLPIIVPQQMFNMSSVTRNIGLSSTVFCPGPINDPCSQTDKSTLGNTLFVINPNSVVPISSNISTSSRIILPQQAAVVGNDTLIPTVISATVNPVPQATSEQATVPLQPKPQADKSSEKIVQSSEITGSIVCAQNNSNDRSSNTIHTDNTVSSLTSESAGEVCAVAEAATIPTSSENVAVPKASDSGKLSKAPSPIRHARNIHHNSLPSLQVLSANKIISLANQSQRGRSTLPLPILSKDSVQTPSVSLLQNADKSPQSSNSFCLQIDTPSVSTNLNRDAKCTTSCQNAPVTSSMQTKSDFSLTVLMGNSSNDKKDSSASKIPNLSRSQNLSQTNTIVSTMQSNNIIKNNVTSSSAALVTSLTHSTIPTSSIATTMVKNSNMLTSVSPIHTSYTIHNTMAHLGSSKVSDSVKNVQKSPNCAKSVELNGEVSLSTNSSLNCDNSSANMSVLGSSTNMTTTVASNTLTTVNSSLQFLNVCSKSSLSANRDPSIIQKQAGYKHVPGTGNQVVTVDVTNNAFSEPYGMINTGLNQNAMPSLFSTNQIVTLHSSGFMCPVQDAVASSIDLHNVRMSSEASHTTAVSCGISSSDNPSFNMLNKGNMHPSTFSMLSVSNESSKRPNESEISVSIGSVSHFPEKIHVQESQKPGKATAPNDSPKQSPNSKKRKNGQKACKPPSKDMQTLCNTNDIVEINTNYELNKPQSDENPDSFSKQDNSDCLPQEFNNSMFTSDILARATESIFENDMLDSPHAPKEAIIYYTDNNPHINVPVSVPNKQNSSSYKFHCISNRAHVDTTTNVQSVNSKKSLGTNHMFSANLPNQTNHPNNQDQLNQKQSKTFKGRKSKGNLDLEPPLKKLKENSDQSIKSTVNQNFENQTNVKNTISCTQTIISSEPKQTLTESSVPEADSSVMDSITHFGNQIHIPESNCKTPTSVDAIFSLTPMLGDILKDVSHGMGVENRNGYLSCNDNQALFPEKHFLSLNFTNSNEEYLNLPRMHFPVSSEMSSAPLPPTTNVSFVHTMSLCSTQSDSSKTTETLSSTNPQNKSEAKKNSLCNTPNSPSLHNNNLTVGNIMTKSSSEFLSKLNNPEPSFSIASKVSNAPSSALFDNQAPTIQTSSSNISHTTNSIMQQADSRFPRDNFASSSHNVPFYPPLSSSSNHQSFVPSTSSSLPHTSFHHNSSANLANLSFPIQTVCSGTNTTYHSTVPKVDSLSHSLCSLLKETSNILVDNRTGNNGSSSQSMSTSSNSNISQSKYSALSLISDHTSYSEPSTSSACHPEYVHSSVVCTPTVSDAQFTPVNPCSRNQRSSLSYSAESLLQTSCASSEKNKNKNLINNRYAQRTAEKKSERGNIANMHGISDTNIFMPVSSCDISIQNAPLVPLPPVTSFHNFSSTYTLCDTVPSTTIFNSVSRPHEIPLSLSNENFLNHMTLSVESQMLSNRHEASTVPKPHTNINLPFESHGPLYNNCNFLPHVKSTIETSRASESAPCFPPTSFSNNYSQSTQKANCCHFPHRNLPSNAEHPVDISLSVGPPVPPFHSEKPNFQANRPSLQPTFSQANTNFVGNLFYSTSRDNMNSKPSNITPSQELFVPEGPRQNLHDHNPIYPNRKAAPSNRSKSKKGKSVNINEGNVNMIPNSIGNFSIPQDPNCNKPNISCIPNGYFKNNAHSVIPPPPSQLPCSQHKISENTNTVIPPNPSFNPVLHQQGDNFFNLNFQPSNFTMSPLPRPPTQPLSCSCLTTPIISHTFSSTNHPVPNFNLSNILPDMGCSSNQVPLPSVKFPPVNHGIQSSTVQCQTNSTISNSAHIISHQTCAPALYPPHPPIVRGSLNPILSHNPQFGDNQVPLVGTGAPPVLPQNATFAPTQNPPFRNVIHSLSFPRNER